MSRTLLIHSLLVGVGGFLGSVLRFLLSGWAQRAVPGSTLPLGTLLVNVSGCLLIGVLAGLVDIRQLLAPGQRVFLMIGILGGFTTFSTFGYETLVLLQESGTMRAGLNIALQVTLGIGAAWLGYALVRVV